MHTVEYTVISQDGHRQTGRYEFQSSGAGPGSHWLIYALIGLAVLAVTAAGVRMRRDRRTEDPDVGLAT